MSQKEKRSDCPISYSLDIWGDRWSLLILRDLFFMNKCTYGDFLKSEEKIATNILASKLQNLEKNGIIQKMHHPDSKIKVPYRLTRKGIDLLPVLVEIYLWADKYFNTADAIRARIQEAKKDKDGFVKKLMAELVEKVEDEKL